MGGGIVGGDEGAVLEDVPERLSTQLTKKSVKMLHKYQANKSQGQQQLLITLRVALIAAVEYKETEQRSNRDASAGAELTLTTGKS